MKFSSSFQFGKNTFLFSLQSIRTPNHSVLGILSRCEDSKHVQFFDWDCTKYDYVKDELIALQKQERMSEIYLWNSTEGKDKYHAMCLDKRTFAEVWRIIHQTSCDFAFKKVVSRQPIRSWVVRISHKGDIPQPKFLEIIKSNYHDHPQSLAHALFIKKWYGVPADEILQNSDGLTSVKLLHYKTAKV